MKMKTIYMLCLSALVFTSCNDILDRPSQTTSEDDTYWTNEDKVRLYANDFYTYFFPGYGLQYETTYAPNANYTFDDDDFEVNVVVDERALNPSDFLSQAVTADEIQEAIAGLPVRQQQAFMLRAWEGFDTATTAQIMNCSEGSVKTHYHRAIQGLRNALAHLNPHLGGSSE